MIRYLGLATAFLLAQSATAKVVRYHATGTITSMIPAGQPHLPGYEIGDTIDWTFTFDTAEAHNNFNDATRSFYQGLSRDTHLRIGSYLYDLPLVDTVAIVSDRNAPFTDGFSLISTFATKGEFGADFGNFGLSAFGAASALNNKSIDAVTSLVGLTNQSFTISFNYQPNNPTRNTVGSVSGPLTISIAGVPEPANWALMIGGFGMVAAAARRRRSRVTA